MPDSTPPAASPTPTTPADRLKGCIKVLTGLKADNNAKTDIAFVVGECLDLMLIVQNLTAAAQLMSAPSKLEPAPAKEPPKVETPAVTKA